MLLLNSTQRRYIVTIIIILLSVSVMRDLLYESSKDVIRALVPYRQKWITSIMQAYSVVFDGDYCVWFCGFMLVFGFATAAPLFGLVADLGCFLAEACPDCPFLSADYESPTLASSSETSSPA